MFNRQEDGKRDPLRQIHAQSTMVDDFTTSDSLSRGNWLQTTSPKSNFSDKYLGENRFRLHQNEKEPSHGGPNSLEESNLVFIHSREPRLGLWYTKAKKTLFGVISFFRRTSIGVHSFRRTLPGAPLHQNKRAPSSGLKKLQQRLACSIYY